MILIILQGKLSIYFRNVIRLTTAFGRTAVSGCNVF